MRIPRTLSLYVMRETLIYCALAFGVLTLVLLTQNLLRRLDELFLVGMTLADLRVVVACVFPVALSYSIPLAFLVGILLSVRRLGADGELIGMRSAGIGPTAFLMPHLLLGLLSAGLSAWLLSSVEHESRRELVQLFKTVAARGAIIEPGKFRRIGTHMVFVEERERDGSLGGVMIYDESQRTRPFHIFANRGRLRFDSAVAEIELELHDGDLHLRPVGDEPDRYQRMRFDTFLYRMDVRHILGAEYGPVRPKQMNRAELQHVLARAEAGDPLSELDQRDPLEYALELHRRWSLPWAPVLFAAIAVTIGLASEARGRSLGLLAVLVAAFGYYALGSLAEAMAHDGWLGAAAASWLPNGVFAIVAVALALREPGRIRG